MIEFLLKIIFHEFFGIPLIVIFFTFFSFYFIIISKFYHFRKINNVVSYLKSGFNEKKTKSSSIGVLMSCIGTVLGIGNIIGGCMSVKIAGPGVLLWVLVCCIMVSVLKFYENAVSLSFKAKQTKVINGNISYRMIGKSFGFLGGSLAVLYIAAFCIGYFVNGLVQVNQIFSIFSIDKSMEIGFSMAVAIFIFYILSKGFGVMSRFMEICVPYMFISYIFICLYSIYFSQYGFIETTKIILIDSMNPAACGIGFLIGYAIRRLCFAADVGTGLSATMASDVTIDPKKQGVISVFEIVFVGITVFITGFTVVSSGLDLSSLSGILIMKLALNDAKFIHVIFSTIIILFGLTTACSCGFLAKRGVESFLSSKRKITNYILLFLIIVYSISSSFASSISFSAILNTLDVCLIFAAVVNILAIFRNRKLVSFSR
jgi:alanine or glycine:cation symporter, AGCS family